MQSRSMFRRDTQHNQPESLSFLLRSALESGRKEDQQVFQHTMFNRLFPQVYLMALEQYPEPDKTLEAIFNTFFEQEMRQIVDASDEQIDQCYLAIIAKSLSQ